MTDTMTAAPRLSPMAAGLLQSEILKISGQIRALVAAGREICNLTVGDFKPAEFPVPPALADGVVAALRAGETNYPPSNGLPELRAAIVEWYRRRQGLTIEDSNVLVASGARPVLYATYATLCAPGDRVVFPVPSWNNNHYCHLVGAEAVRVRCAPEDDFLPTRASLEPVVRDARLVVLTSPCNPTGTMLRPEALADICDLVLEENARRGPGERPLYLLYDQVYWMLTFGGIAHANPMVLRPAIADYTVAIDGISKALAATGLRVGWSVAPRDVTSAMSDFLGHVGAWAPRAEQVATAKLLLDDAALDAHLATMTGKLRSRLSELHDAIAALGAKGMPVRASRPEGAMYLSAQFAVHGRRTPEGRVLDSDEAIRTWLLDAAGMAVVMFQAFGAQEDSGWCRLSVGAVSEAELQRVVPRLEAALGALR